MAQLSHRKTLSFLGLVYWGDLGPYTLYKGKRCQLILFYKTYPDRPPTQRQLDQWAKFKGATLAWTALPVKEKLLWERLTRKCSLCMNGYNLFLYWKLSGDDATILTLKRQAGPPVPAQPLEPP